MKESKEKKYNTKTERENIERKHHIKVEKESGSEM